MSPELKPGDRVKLRWNGTYHLPMWLSYSWATVVSITAMGNIVVQPDFDTGPRTVKREHILKEGGP